MTDNSWFRLTTDPNIRDEFNRYLIVEDIGGEIFDESDGPPKSFNPPEYEYRTFMVHQIRDNSGTGFPVGDWYERERFEVDRHLIEGHYGESTDYEGNTVSGWITDELIIQCFEPKFLQWEKISAPEAFAGVDPRVKSLVARNTAAEQPTNEPSPR